MINFPNKVKIILKFYLLKVQIINYSVVLKKILNKRNIIIDSSTKLFCLWWTDWFKVANRESGRGTSKSWQDSCLWWSWVETKISKLSCSLVCLYSYNGEKLKDMVLKAPFSSDKNLVNAPIHGMLRSLRFVPMFMYFFYFFCFAFVGFFFLLLVVM